MQVAELTDARGSGASLRLHRWAAQGAAGDPAPFRPEKSRALSPSRSTSSPFSSPWTSSTSGGRCHPEVRRDRGMEHRPLPGGPGPFPRGGEGHRPLRERPAEEALSQILFPLKGLTLTETPEGTVKVMTSPKPSGRGIRSPLARSLRRAGR